MSDASEAADAVATHLRDCAKVDAAIVMQEGSADAIVASLLIQGWTWSERPTEHVAGKRIRYLCPPPGYTVPTAPPKGQS